MRTDFRPSGTNGQRNMVGNSMREPIPIRRCPQPNRPPPSSARVRAHLLTMPRSAAERHQARRSVRQARGFHRGRQWRRCDEDHRRLAAGDQRGGGLDALVSGLRCGKRSNGFATPVSARCVNTSQAFPGHRPAPARQHLLECAADQASAPCRDIRCGRPISRNFAVWRAGRHLVQMAAALAEILRRHLSGQAQHRLIRSVCRQQGSAGVERPRAGHNAEHAGPAGGSRIAHRPCSRRPVRGARR